MSAGAKPPVRDSCARRSRIGFLFEMRGMKNVIVEAAQITRIRNSRRWITNRIVMVVYLGFWEGKLFTAGSCVGRAGLDPGPALPTHEPFKTNVLRLCGLQPGDNQHTGVRPEGTIRTFGQVRRCWPVG